MSDVFEGKNCIVTGASTGIGWGLSKRLLERGANVWGCSRTSANVKAAGEGFSNYGDRVHYEVDDVRYADQVTAK